MESNVQKWLNESIQECRDGGLLSGGLVSSRALFNSFWFGLTSRHPLGTNVFDLEWDLLLVLDGCRVDALEEVANEYDFLTNVSSIWSTGSASHEWTVKTFTREYEGTIENTALITANPFARWAFEEGERPPRNYTIPFDISAWDVIEADDFEYVEWCTDHKHPYEHLFAAPPPRHMTDRAILAGRQQNADRMIVHYFQPHRPFIDKALETGELENSDDYPYNAVQAGEISSDELWSRYLDNLRLVLDDIELLLENIDAERVAISADHGELMGEFGLYGHPEGVPHPNLKRVPWALTSATDHQTHDPKGSVEEDTETSAEERLEALGYL